MKLGMPQLFEYDDIEDNFRLAQKLGLDFIEFNMNFELMTRSKTSLNNIVKKSPCTSTMKRTLVHIQKSLEAI